MLLWPNVEEIALNRTDFNVHASAHLGTKLCMYVSIAVLKVQKCRHTTTGKKGVKSREFLFCLCTFTRKEKVIICPMNINLFLNE